MKISPKCVEYGCFRHILGCFKSQKKTEFSRKAKESHACYREIIASPQYFKQIEITRLESRLMDESCYYRQNSASSMNINPKWVKYGYFRHILECFKSQKKAEFSRKSRYLGIAKSFKAHGIATVAHAIMIFWPVVSQSASSMKISPLWVKYGQPTGIC